MDIKGKFLESNLGKIAMKTTTGGLSLGKQTISRLGVVLNGLDQNNLEFWREGGNGIGGEAYRYGGSGGGGSSGFPFPSGRGHTQIT
jgi:hypothetical protein